MWTMSSGFGPDVRKRQIPGIMPVALPSEKAMRARPRPKSAIVVPKETKHQQFILYGMQRSSDLIGAAESKVPAADTLEDSDPAKMNYDAQFLYNDWRVKPIGGLKRKTTSLDRLFHFAKRFPFPPHPCFPPYPPFTPPSSLTLFSSMVLPPPSRPPP